MDAKATKVLGAMVLDNLKLVMKHEFVAFFWKVKDCGPFGGLSKQMLKHRNNRDLEREGRLGKGMGSG